MSHADAMQKIQVYRLSFSFSSSFFISSVSCFVRPDHVSCCRPRGLPFPVHHHHPSFLLQSPHAGAAGLFDRFHHDFFFLNCGCPAVVCVLSPVSALRMIAKRAMARSSPWSAARTYHTLASRGFRRQPMPISVK